MNDLWNLTQTFNWPVLFFAANDGHVKMVELLLRQEGIDINDQDILNQKTFIKFKTKFFFHSIENLNDLWNLTGTFNKTALMYAVKAGHKEIAELLLKQKGIKINAKDIFNLNHS